MSPNSEFKIGDWWIYPQVNELRRGDERRSLAARPMEVLVCLVRHAPDPVSTERLIQEVWEGAIVGLEVVTSALHAIRTALGDSARNPTYIETLHRRGYRVIAPCLRKWAPEPGVELSGYVLTKEIGSGAMGEVFLAEDPSLNRTVVIKILAANLAADRVARRRFRREAEIVAAVDDPYVVDVFEMGDTPDGRLYLVSRDHGLTTLKEELSSRRLAADEAVQIAIHIARGLAAVHGQGVIHRDVKPGNVLLARDGRAKLFDFGIAKLTGSTQLTGTGASLGTPAYKSPEQTQGSSVDHRTDLWSLGVVLYEMLAGRRPFLGDYETAIVHSILEEEPAPITELPRGLWKALLRALEKKPKKRFQSAEEMIAALKTAFDPTPMPRRWRRAAAWVAAALLVIWALAETFDRLAVGEPVRSMGGEGLLAGDDSSLTEGERIVLEAQQGWQGDDPAVLASRLEDFEEALDLEPDNPVFKAYLAFDLARLYEQVPEEADPREIVTLAETAYREAPDVWPVPLALSRVRSQFDRSEAGKEEAHRLALRAFHLRPTSRDRNWTEEDLAYTRLGVAQIAVGEVDEGLDNLEAARATGQRLRASLVWAQHQRRKSEAAVQAAYLEVLDEWPWNFTALNNLGVSYLLDGSYGAAKKPLMRAYNVAAGDPNRASARFAAFYNHRAALAATNYAGVLYSLAFNGSEWLLDGLSEAETFAQSAVRHKETYSSAHLTLGDIYLRQDRLEDARRAFEAALPLYEENAVPSHSDPREIGRYAVCLSRLGRHDEALAEIERALAEVSDEAWLSYWTTRVYAAAGKREPLLRHLRYEAGSTASEGEIRRDPSFDSWHGDPAFEAILEGEDSPSIVP